MKKISLIVFTMIFLSCSAQTGDSTNKLSGTMKDELGEKEINMTVKSGETFTVRLRSQAGTGYSWKLMNSSPGLTTQNGKETYENVPDSKPGSAGLQTFYFKANKTGTETIHFIYQQPFVKPIPENAPRKTVFVKIE